MKNIAINGLGRIGRMVLRHYLIDAPDTVQIVAANDLTPIDELAYLIRYDSVHRRATFPIKTGSDYIANTCPFCALAFYPYLRRYSFKVKDISTIINESMGGREYEDKLEKYWRCKSVDEIIEKSRENFEANGYKEEEMRHILPLLFGFAGP